MYFSRIRFNILNQTYIDFESKSQVMFSRGNSTCILVGCDEKISCSKKLYLEYGGFSTNEEARKQGISLMNELKLYCVERKIAIKISGTVGETDSTEVSTPTGGITAEGKKWFGYSQESQFEVLGLGMYEVISSLKEIPFISSSCNPQSNIKNFSLAGIGLEILNVKVLRAISLLNSSNVLIQDSRISFLLDIMSVEALVSEKQKKDGEMLVKINDLLDEISDSDLKNLIGSLKNKSISQKSREIVLKYCSENAYNNKIALEFWKECYILRSKFVHNGTVPIEDVQSKKDSLRMLVLDTLKGYICEYCNS